MITLFNIHRNKSQLLWNFIIYFIFLPDWAIKRASSTDWSITPNWIEFDKLREYTLIFLLISSVNTH